MIKDYNDRLILDYDEDSNKSVINIDLYISKKIPPISISIFMRLNEFIVEKHLSSKYNEECEIDINYSLRNNSEFYIMTISISYLSDESNKHSQVIRDAIYELIFGVSKDFIVNDVFNEHLSNYMKTIVKERKPSSILEKSKYIDKTLFKKTNIFSSGDSFDFDEYIQNEFTNNNLMKKYKVALNEIRLYCFKKNMSVEYSFQNYTTFYKKIFYSINSVLTSINIEHKNIKIRNIDRLSEKNMIFSLYSIIENNVCRLTFYDMFLNNAFEDYFTSIKKNDNKFDHRLYKYEDNSYIVQYNIRNEEIKLFPEYFKRYVTMNLNIIKNKYLDFLLETIKKSDWNYLLFLLDFSDINYDKLSDGIEKLISEIGIINSNEIINSLAYKNML